MKCKKNKTRKIYTKKDYNSNDGMLTSVWGPPAWHFLHTISFNYPNSPSIKQKKFMSKPKVKRWVIFAYRNPS